MLNLEIPSQRQALGLTGALSVQQCLDSYFCEKPLHDYSHRGRKTHATHRYQISRLPNVLCLHLKRFIYTDRPVKLKEHVAFEEVLEICDSLVSTDLRVGIFNSAADASFKAGVAARYRLFSVVEH